MAFWTELNHRLAWLFRRSRFDRELEEEIRLHIEERANELQETGLSREDALFAARREFGPTLRSQEDTRSA